MDALEQLKLDLGEGRIGGERLVELIGSLQRQLLTLQQQLQAAQLRIAELEKLTGGTGTTKVAEPFSMRAEEKRQQACQPKKKPKRGRRGRLNR